MGLEMLVGVMGEGAIVLGGEVKMSLAVVMKTFRWVSDSCRQTVSLLLW